jgi:hypothetical protein
MSSEKSKTDEVKPVETEQAAAARTKKVMAGLGEYPINADAAPGDKKMSTAKIGDGAGK